MVNKGNTYVLPFCNYHLDMTESEIREARDSDWESLVEKNPDPVFVMFYSPACSHCIQIQPYIEDIARNFAGRVAFVKLNIIRYGWLAERYGIMATPTFQFFCGGKPVQTRVGAVFPAMLKKMIQEMIEHGEECRMSSTDTRFEITGYG
jgi:thioredoxin-like negative regulator of GroEL